EKGALVRANGAADTDESNHTHAEQEDEHENPDLDGACVVHGASPYSERMPARISTACSICSSETISGGARRTAFGATLLTTKPFASALPTISAAQSPPSSIAISKPRPRISPTAAFPLVAAASAPISFSPASAARATSPSLSITSSTASAAEHGTGPPPNVVA